MEKSLRSSTAIPLEYPISPVGPLESTLSADYLLTIPWTLGSLDSDRILAPKLGPFAIPRELQVIQPQLCRASPTGYQ